MQWLDVKYVNMLSSYLRNFKRKSSNLWNFSCPYCGDSLNNERKARGFIYEAKNKVFYHCHNCSITRPFNKFLKEQNHLLYSDFVKERLLDKKEPNKIEILAKETRKTKAIDGVALTKLISINQLKNNDPHKKYVTDRLIPEEFYDRLYYCSNFIEWTIDLVPEKKEELEKAHEHSRLVIPFFSKENKFVAYQGRSFNENDNLRYITIILDSLSPKVYGLERYSNTRLGYVTEGPLDSLFLPNCISTAGGDIAVTIGHLDFDKDNLIIIYDNERRSKDTINKMNKAINAGYKVFFWPDENMGKDINKAILNGLTRQEIKDIVDQNSYGGLKALNMMASWKMVDNTYKRMDRK